MGAIDASSSGCAATSRPPLAQDRVALRADGRLELTLKSVWKDGTRAVVFEPHELIARLVAAVPPPRLHLVRYFGVLSSHSKLRAEVVPKRPQDPTAHAPPAAEGDQLELVFEPEASARGRRRWAWLLRHVFAAALDTCRRCEGPMRWIEAATTTADVARLLAELGLGARAPPSGAAPRPP